VDLQLPAKPSLWFYISYGIRPENIILKPVMENLIGLLYTFSGFPAGDPVIIGIFFEPLGLSFRGHFETLLLVFPKLQLRENRFEFMGRNGILTVSSVTGSKTNLILGPVPSILRFQYQNNF
jgi:hypothetical protein